MDARPLVLNGNWENISITVEVLSVTEMQATVVVPVTIKQGILDKLRDSRVVQSDLALLRIANHLSTEFGHGSPAQQCSNPPDFTLLFTSVQTADLIDQAMNWSQIPSCGVCGLVSCVASSVMRYQRAELPGNHPLWRKTWKIYGLDWHTSLMREVQFLLKTLLGVQVEFQQQSFVPICQSKGVCVTDPRFVPGSLTEVSACVHAAYVICCTACSHCMLYCFQILGVTEVCLSPLSRLSTDMHM